MANSIKDQEAILAKLNIYELNPMQLEAVEAIKESNNIISCCSYDKKNKPKKTHERTP